jgi:hypothetical protein
MTARTLESVSTCLADWSILVIGNSMPPRDPKDDDDDDDNDEEDGDAESDEDEPAVIREPDENFRPTWVKGRVDAIECVQPVGPPSRPMNKAMTSRRFPAAMERHRARGIVLGAGCGRADRGWFYFRHNEETARHTPGRRPSQGAHPRRMRDGWQ